jgi:Pyruvate/2-oxoacid:ferredoxin oxidoreductase gamma subunit
VPERVKQQLARLRPRLYTIDATSVAKEVGLGRRTNMVMQAAFFALSGVMPLDQVRGGMGGCVLVLGGEGCDTAGAL